MSDMDHKLSVKDGQALENVMYEARTNEQGLSNPDNREKMITAFHTTEWGREKFMQE